MRTAESTLSERLAALEQRVRVLEGRQRIRDEQHVAALVALAASTRDLTFTAVSAIANARQMDPELLAALMAAGVDTPRTLGRWLRLCSARRSPDWCRTAGTNGDGTLWVFRAAD